MSRIRHILVVLLLLVTFGACQRRPIEEEYLRVYLDLTIDKEVTNHKVQGNEPGLMRVAFFDAETKEYICHDYVQPTGGYIFAPYGNVDMVVYNLDAGETRIRNYYSFFNIEAYTNEVSEHEIKRFANYLLSRVDTRPSYDKICVTPDHLFVARESNIHIPQHLPENVFVIKTTARTIVESWTIEIDGITGMEWVGSVAMMLSGQIDSEFIILDKPSTESIALYFDVVSASRRNTVMTSGFETFGREKTSGDIALLSILFTDIQGHPYMYNFDVSDQMEDNPKQHIVIKEANINIPKPEVGGGFKPEVDDWKEYEYDIDI